MILAQSTIISNIPWTQVVIAVCAAIGTLIALITIFHKLATLALTKAVGEIRRDLRRIRHMVSSLNKKVTVQNGRIGKLESKEPKDGRL
jgi:hypothetical protein